jgi:hypothetical protein
MDLNGARLKSVPREAPGEGSMRRVRLLRSARISDNSEVFVTLTTQIRGGSRRSRPDVSRMIPATDRERADIDGHCRSANPLVTGAFDVIRLDSGTP